MYSLPAEAACGHKVSSSARKWRRLLDGRIIIDMRIEFYGIYRLQIGNKSVEFDLPHGSTVYDALQAITQRYPNLRDEIFDQNGKPYPYLPLYINGRNPRLLADGLQSTIDLHDVLSIFSPISSGRINVEEARKTRANHGL
jgi:MoaD family protein